MATISGNVVNVDGTFSSGAKVWVNNVVYSASGQMLWTFTDSFGNWAVAGLSQGSYRITVTSPGVIFRSSLVVTIISSDIANLNFQAFALNA